MWLPFLLMLIPAGLIIAALVVRRSGVGSMICSIAAFFALLSGSGAILLDGQGATKAEAQR